MTDFKDLMARAKDLQDKFKETQEALKTIEVEGVAAAGQVRLLMNGEGELKKVFIDESLFKESKQIIEDLLLAAHSDAKSKLKKRTSEEISKVAGTNLPPGFKLPF